MVFERYMRRTFFLLLVAGLAACSGIEVKVDQDPAAGLTRHQDFALVGTSLRHVEGISELALAIDTGIRHGLRKGMESKGFREQEQSGGLLVDYLLIQGLEVNEDRLDSPTDYQRSWRTGRSAVDATGSMAHTVATVEFFRQVELTVEIRSSADNSLLWRATGRGSYAAEDRDPQLLREWLENIALEVLKKLPAR